MAVLHLKQCEQKVAKLQEQYKRDALEKRLNKTARAGADGVKSISGEMGSLRPLCFGDSLFSLTPVEMPAILWRSAFVEI